MFEKIIECLLVCFVITSEPCLVDTIQKVVINPTISYFFNLLFELGWEEIVLSCLQRFEIVMEHSYDFLALVVDDCIRLFVKENGNCKWLFKTRASILVYSSHVMQIIDSVNCFTN